MRLRRLQIDRLPGIRPGFTLDDFTAGVNVVVGPNASGKSSLLRALRAALYRDEQRHEGVHVEATFDDGDAGGTLTAARIGDDLHWQRDGVRIEAPPLPEPRFLACYTLGVEDLLDEDHGTDTEIAARLARELAGGYDLRAVRESPPFRLKQTHGRTESNKLTEADKALRQRVQAQQQLQRDEARLETLRQQKAEAERAGREADLHQRALDLLERRRQRRALEEQLEHFPAGMDQLRGDEQDTLKELREQLERQQTERRNAADQHTQAETTLRDSGLADAQLDEGALADYRPALNRLREIESRLEQKQSELAQAEATLRQAVEALGGEAQLPVQLDPATVREVEQALEEKRDENAVLRQLNYELQKLPFGDAPDPDPQRLRSARDELLRWLAAPRTPAWTATRVTAALALFGAGIAATAVAAHALHDGLLALLLPLAWGGYILIFRTGECTARRREAEQRFAESGQPEPEEWSRGPVEDQLHALDGSVIHAEHEADGIKRRAEVTRELSSRRETLAEVDQRLDTIARQVGHDPNLLDTSLQRWLRLVADHDQARRNTDSLRAERDRLATEAERLRRELLAFLSCHHESPGNEQPDAESLSARVERLAARLRQRDQALQDRDRSDRDIRRLDQDIERTRKRISDVFERAGLTPDDDNTLRQRMERLADWKELRQALHDTRRREADREQELRERDDLLQAIENHDEDALHTRHDLLREQADGLEDLIREITRIESEIERAGHERALETARAEYQQARDRLNDRLDEALYAEAGQFLLERVEAEHEQAVQPAALRQAREWFKRFTHYQYELVFATDGDTRFAARETASGEHRRLSELSSGTRMQLLLAVRIAFALSAERGTTRLPLILDEALTTADPERFRAVAESLTLLAREDGRQVFYLTAQPDDARYWAEHDPEVHCIDLAERRGRERAIDAPEAVTPIERPAVPEPGEQTPEEYAVAVGVPPIDPWSEPEGIHAFFLLRDDLPLLQRLLEAGVHRAGQIETLLSSDAADTLLSADQRTWLRGRIEGTKAWIHAWRHGRGRPVDRAALEASGAVSDTFIDRVAALNDHVGGDGQTLIDRLAASEVPRFYTDKREQLETWLLDNGYISSQTTLESHERELRVVSAMRAWVTDGETVNSHARTLVQSLEGGLQS